MLRHILWGPQSVLHNSCKIKCKKIQSNPNIFKNITISWPRSFKISKTKNKVNFSVSNRSEWRYFFLGELSSVGQFHKFFSKIVRYLACGLRFLNRVPEFRKLLVKSKIFGFLVTFGNMKLIFSLFVFKFFDLYFLRSNFEIRSQVKLQK